MSRIYTRTVRNVDKKIVGMENVPKVSELSFENDTIRNTVPTLFRYIGNENDKTITKRQDDEKIHTCQRTRRNQVQHKHNISYQVPRVYGVYRMVRIYGEHVHHVSDISDFTEWYGYIVSTSE